MHPLQPHRPQFKWTHERIAALDNLRAQGKSNKECAKLLGCTEDSIAGLRFRQREQERKGQPPPPPPAPIILPPPPSPAMLALAAFDPVIAYAVQLRRAGLKKGRGNHWPPLPEVD